MKAKGKKFISLFLVLSLVAINCAIFRSAGGKRERPGVMLQIMKKNGLQIAGELIAVKSNSLLLLNLEGLDESVGVADIKFVRIVKPSKLGKGATIGGVIGAVGGLGSLLALKSMLDENGGLDVAFQWYLIFPAVGATGCAIVGGLIGALSGIDEIIQIEGKSDSEIRKALDKLRKKARIRDYK